VESGILARETIILSIPALQEVQMGERVAGKRVLITGAARGMGRSHAVRLAEEGADLILVDVCESFPELEYQLGTADELAETAELVQKLGRRAVTRTVDVRDAAALQAAVDEGVAELGGLEASVANAGVLTAGTWQTTTPEQWRLVVDINLIGVWNTCRAALPHLGAGASLVNISSAAGIKGNPLTLPYTAAKHGVVGLTKALANELGAKNIRANTVHPTGVITGMTPMSLFTLITEERPDLGSLYENAMPESVIDASEVSNAVLFLVSDESSFVTGTELKVDAGVTIR
jgi:SDR family mycofactocin-dependent oxidoreductase